MSDIEMLAARVKSAQEAVNYQKSILARSRIFGWSRAAEASRLAECREELCKGRARVPMNAGVRKALEEARRLAMSGHVIEWNGQRIASIKTGFGKAVRNAQLHDVTPHVLRHSAAVWMASEGVPMSRIAQYLGHSSEAVTFKVYARYAPDHLRDEADILDV